MAEDSVNSEIKIHVESTGRDPDKLSTSLDKLAKSEEALQVSTEKVNKVRERSVTAIERLAQKLDLGYRAERQMENAQNAVNRAFDSGLQHTRAYEIAVGRLAHMQGQVSGGAKLARHELINLGRQFQDVGVSLAGGQNPLLVLVQQGSQIADIFSSSPHGAGGAMKAFAGTALRALISPLGAASGFVGAIAAIELAANMAGNALAKLGEESRRVGLSPSVVQRAKTLGAGVGLGPDKVTDSLANTQREFSQYGRNEGAVKETLSRIDKGFLGILDKARTTGEFIDIINEKIRSLPKEEARQLAEALYNPDAAARFIEEIERGNFSMSQLAKVTGDAGSQIDKAARDAESMQLKIDQAAQVADNKLLVAFSKLGHPIDSLKLTWYGVVGSIGDAIANSQRLQDVFNALLHPIDALQYRFNRLGQAYDWLDKKLGARPVVSLENERPTLASAGMMPRSDFAEAKSGFLPQLATPSVGQARSRFAAREPTGRTRKSDAERAGERFEDIKQDLIGKIELASAEALAHDQVALKIRIETEQRRLGKGATDEQKTALADLVTQLDEAEHAQKRLTEANKAFAEALKEVGEFAKDALKGLLSDMKEGESVGKRLETILRRMGEKGISGGIDSLVNSASGKLGGGLSGLFSGGKSSGGGFLDSLIGGVKGIFGFADGGIMTSKGPLQLQKFADGGVATSPTLAMFGEGSGAEAFVPLKDGGIPVNMQNMPSGPGVSIQVINSAPGVEVSPQVNGDEIMIAVRAMVDSKLDQHAKAMPKYLRDRQNREK